MNKNMWRRLENSVSPQDSITGGCVHEAAHAVVAMALGLRVTKIWTDIENTPHSLPDGETRAGGSCHFDSIHCVHVGAIAVYAGPIANGKILRHHGYSETVASAVESMCASTDNQVVCDWMRDEKFVWPRQAQIDAERFVSDPVVWEQVIDEDGDTAYQRITTDTQYPMRLSKWERVLRTKLLMKGWFHGKFVVNKQGTAISLELKE